MGVAEGPVAALAHDGGDARVGGGGGGGGGRQPGVHVGDVGSAVGVATGGQVGIAGVDGHAAESRDPAQALREGGGKGARVRARYHSTKPNQGDEEGPP